MRLRNLSSGRILPNKFPRRNQERNQAQVKAKFLANKPEHNHFKGSVTLTRPGGTPTSSPGLFPQKMGGAGPGIGWSRVQPKYSCEDNLYATRWFCADRRE